MEYNVSQPINGIDVSSQDNGIPLLGPIPLDVLDNSLYAFALDTLLVSMFINDLCADDELATAFGDGAFDPLGTLFDLDRDGVAALAGMAGTRHARTPLCAAFYSVEFV